MTNIDEGADFSTNSSQQTQTRLAKQRKYYRQIRAKMTQELHTALIEKGTTKKNSTGHLLIMKFLPLI